MNKFSVIIITKDEEKNISDCLKSVQWADEIIIVDAESKDRTVEIAKNFTDKIFIRKWDGYVPQKKYALSLANNEWVLSVDADERIASELKNEVQNLQLDKFDGYKIRRRNFIYNKEITSCGWGNDYQLRLFKKKKADLNDRLVHEKFCVEGEIGVLKQPMDHFTFESFTDYLAKINYYTSLKAEELYNKKRKINSWIIFTHTISSFFIFFIMKRGFKDGVYGLVISLLHSISTAMNYLKLWELQIKNPH